jgi:palmitoyltransferase
LIGPLFVCVALTLISACAYTFFGGLLPYWHGSITSPAGIVHTLFAFFLASQLAFNYVATVITSPGHAPVVPKTPANAALLDQLAEERKPPKGQGFSRYCKSCAAPKPPRSHHCGICGKCVLKMDHHCPWVNNCVGHANHRTFTLFLVYLSFSCAWVAAWSYLPNKERVLLGVNWYSFSDRATLVFTFVITSTISVAVGLMAVWHVYLGFSAQTTIEFYFNRWQATQAGRRGERYLQPYDLGFGRNFADFFGVRVPSKRRLGVLDFLSMGWQAIEPSFKGSRGDGIVYDRNDHQDQFTFLAPSDHNV